MLRRVCRTTTPQCILIQRQYSSSRSILPLAYECHLPAVDNARSNSPPIIFLHGLFGSKKNNRAISKRLAKDLGRPVYSLDLRNHGESPHDPMLDYTSMATDVLGFIRHYGLENPALIGHSMGAKTAMTVALQWPEHVSRLIAVDNAPWDTSLGSKFAHYIQGMKKVEAAGVARRTEADSILRGYEESLPIRQFLLGNLHRPAGSDTQQFRIPLSIIAKSLNNLGDFPFKNPAEVRFEKPALFVRGTRSKYVPDEALPLIGQFFPRFRLVDIDAGHWLISEQPEEFRRVVVEFLETPDS